MKTESDENVLEFWKIPSENSIVKMRKDNRLDDGCEIKITLPAQLGGFNLSNRKRVMNNFIREINGFYNKSTYYRDN